MRYLIMILISVSLSACGGSQFEPRCAELIAVAQPKVDALNDATKTKQDVIAVMGTPGPGKEGDSSYTYYFYGCKTYTFNFSGNFVVPSDANK